jgi:hypothetical protein
VRECHARALRADYPALDDRRLSLLADVLAGCEVAARWLDKRGSVVDEGGDVHPVVSDLDRWTAKAWQMLCEVRRECQQKPPMSYDEAMAAWQSGAFGSGTPDD